MTTLLIALLLQAADAELSRIEEWAKGQPDNGAARVGVGDEYWKSSKKFPKDRLRFVDRANEAWATGWPMLDAFWKDKTRDNLKRLYASAAGPAVRPLAKGEWISDGAAVSGERVRSGVASARIPMPKGNEGNYAQPLRCDIKLPAGAKELEVSAWVLADGTNSANDDMKPVVTGAGGKLLSAAGTAIPMDVPVWTPVSQKLKVDGAVKVSVYFEFQSRQGIVFVDDVSVKCDGKELLANGGFER